MGRHAVAEPQRSTSPYRVALLGFLGVCLIATIVAVAMLWPPRSAPQVSPDFHTNFALNHTQVNGTVELVDTNQCDSPQAGLAFEGSPAIVRENTAVSCRRSIVTIDGGANEGKRTILINYDVPGEPVLEEGDKIRLIEAPDATGEMRYTFGDYQRTDALLVWAFIVALVVVAFALFRGLRSLVGLAVTFAVIGTFLLPALLHGGGAVPLAVAAGAAVVFLTVPLVHGVNWKSASSMGGTLIALGLSALLAQAAIATTHLRGLGDEDNLTILLYFPDVSVAGLMLCGFIIGALGGLNDVTISQASTVNELAESDPDASRWQLFRSAMRVGQDHISSMVYTLVLTYVGASLPLLLLVTAAERPLIQTLTSDIVATELVRSAVGALGLTLAVPITTIIAAWTASANRR